MYRSARNIAWISVVLVASLRLVAPAAAQSAPTGAEDCACLADFERLVEKIEANYIGFKLDVTDANSEEYRRLVTDLRARAGRTPGEACVFVLRELTDWFDDGHLFIVEAPAVDSVETRRLASARERIARSEAELRAYFDANMDGLDPVEGIWYDRGLRVGVVRDDASPDRDFVAITLASDAEAWEPGMVKAEIREAGDGDYDIVLYASDQSTRHPYEARLRKGAILHMPPTMWGKAYPVTVPEQTWLDPENPRAPTFQHIDAGTVLFSTPSHAMRPARERLAELVEAHRDQILRAETMIIDIRGNEGGSSWTTRVLAPFYFTDEQRPPLAPEGGAAFVVASPEHIADFTETVGRYEEPPAWMPELLEAMKADTGGVVPMPEASRSGPFRPDTVYAGPENVAIIMDRGAVSAAEAFVLEAGRSRKVTLFGENTGGVIDYQNVELNRLACRARGLLLGYPTIGVPGSRLNGVGIAPHVRIPPNDADWVAFVVDYYRGDAVPGGEE